MILHVDPNAPLWVHAAATSALALHIGSGSIGLVSGATTLALRKGSPLHRFAGRVFGVSMLTMAIVAAAVAPLLPQRISTLAAVLTLYLVATGWSAARRHAGVRPLELFAALLPPFLVAAGVLLARAASESPAGEVDGQSASGAYLFIALAAIATAGDLHLILRRRLPQAQRIARHLWRMGVALLLAAGAFFQGQEQLFPQPVQDSPLLALPMLAILVLTLFWLLRTLVRGRSGRHPIASSLPEAQ